MESETKLGWITNVKTMLPEELFVALNTRMNGIQMPLLQVSRSLLRRLFVATESLRSLKFVVLATVHSRNWS